ncbi:cytosolic sulfotransferase 2-like [Kryptolebias marmoratus]|uniref:Sulfotransferase n=1 Tax=Kryptolebias marmoratus TaxID=37003 RepID=A0A3Q3B9C2_KRYMA|nr:cytosolic sulfotransferase 2-like [Kryptolebias marmoratus]
MEIPPRPTLFDFHGVPMTRYFTDNWENVQKFKARPDDIVLASYPKAGNTWVSYILDLLYCRQTLPEQQDSVPLFQRVPFLELYVPGFLNGVDGANQLTGFPRIIKTHLPVQFLPQSFWEQNAKIVYVARNAKDSVVSYFHFDRMNKVQPEPGDWSSFLRRFTEGEMVFGSWYEHVTGWWEKKQTRSNILYLFYEDLSEDFDRELNRLCSFLGVSPSADSKKHVTEKVLFNNMKQNKMVNGSTNEAFDFNVSAFIRKGNVGDWKNHFTVKQDEEFNEDYKRKMKNTDLHFRTIL